MYDEFHVPDVLIVLLYMWRLNSQGDLLKKKSNLTNHRWAISRSYTRQLYKRIHFVHHICSTCLLLLRLISRDDDFDCSVIHTWYKRRYKQSCDWRSHCIANIARTPSWKWERNVDQFSAAVCWEKRWVSTVKTAVWQTTAEHARWVYTNYFQLSKFYCFKRVTFSVTSKASAPKFTEIFTRKLGLDKGYFW